MIVTSVALRAQSVSAIFVPAVQYPFTTRLLNLLEVMTKMSKCKNKCQGFKRRNQSFIFQHTVQLYSIIYPISQVSKAQRRMLAVDQATGEWLIAPLHQSQISAHSAFLS